MQYPSDLNPYHPVKVKGSKSHQSRLEYLGRVRSQPFAPSRAAVHTPVSRHAPTIPLCSATRVQNSGRAVTRSVAQSEASGVAQGWGAIESRVRRPRACSSKHLIVCQRSNTQTPATRTHISRRARTREVAQLTALRVVAIESSVTVYDTRVCVGPYGLSYALTFQRRSAELTQLCRERKES
jgi:hypothetical protein